MIVVCTTVPERAERWPVLAQTFPGLVLCVDEPRPRGRAGSCNANDARAMRSGHALARGEGWFLRVQDDIEAPPDLHAHLDALAEVLPDDALMVSLHTNLGDDAAWAKRHGPLRPLSRGASYFSSHAVLVRASHAWLLAQDLERDDPERHNDVRYLWTARTMKQANEDPSHGPAPHVLYSLIPSLTTHANLPSTLGNPAAPAGIPRSSRTYDPTRSAAEVVSEIVARLGHR